MIGGYSDRAYEMPLHDYQQHAVKWQLHRLFTQKAKGGGLFLDPGLGKTRISCTIVDALMQLKEIKRTLIVAPLRPIYTVWGHEFRKWGFPQPNIILHGQHAMAMAQNLPVELVNYEGLVKLQDIKKRWDLVIFDESTYLKNWSAKRSKYARKMIKTIPHRVCLTGTPAANSLADLHSQCFMIDDGDALGKNVTAFRNRYMTRGGWQGKQFIMRHGVRNELLELISPMVLRMKAEDYLDMPTLVENNIWIKLGSKASNQYRRLKRDLYAELETGEVYALNQAAAYAKCKQFANGQVYSQPDGGGEKISHLAHEEKVRALFELYEELAGKPLLVFFQYTQDLERIRNHPKSPLKKAPVICGDRKYKLKITEVDKLIARWNAGEIPGLLCQWQSTSHGLNMQEACNDIAMFGITDMPETYDQAFRRVYRQGVQGDQVRIHRLLVLDTVEEVMLERLNGKFETQNSFLQALKQHAIAA